MLLLAPDAWLSFWSFNSDRGGDFGSLWYVFSLAGHPVPQLNAVSGGLFALGCLAIGLLILLAPRRPRLGQVAFLVVAAFLMTNKVYSPQYVLWLLPLLVLARPRWRDWWSSPSASWSTSSPSGGTSAGCSPPATARPTGSTGSPCSSGWPPRLGGGVVVRDILRPAHDPVRGVTVPTTRPAGRSTAPSTPPWLTRFRHALGAAT